MRKIIFFYSFLLILIIASCSEASKPSSVIAKQDGENIVIETDTFHKYKVELSIGDNIVLSDSISGSWTKHILKTIQNSKSIDKVAIAYNAMKNDYNIYMRCKIEELVDTTFSYKLTPFVEETSNSSIVGFCAPLVRKSNLEDVNVALKTWLYRNKFQFNDSIVRELKGVLWAIKKNEYNDYYTSEKIPVCTDWSKCNYKVNSSLVADYYALFATTSQEELDKFVESEVTTGLKRFTGTMGSMTCYANYKKAGYKTIMLIGLNKSDWSYQIIPLGVVALDVEAPKRADLVFFNKIMPSDRANINSVKRVTFKNKTRINFGSKPPIFGDYSLSMLNWDGNGLECNVSFRILWAGDIKSVTIVRTPDLCYKYISSSFSEWTHKPEKKKIDLTEYDGSYTFTYKLHFEDGDNIIPFIVEDIHGNQSRGELINRAKFTRTPDTKIDIENNIDIDVD